MIQSSPLGSIAAMIVKWSWLRTRDRYFSVKKWVQVQDSSYREVDSRQIDPSSKSSRFLGGNYAEKWFFLYCPKYAHLDPETSRANPYGKYPSLMKFINNGCTTTQHYAASHKDSLTTKSIGLGSPVVKISDRGWLCHEFETSTTKDPPSPQISRLSCWVQSKGHSRLDAGCKGQSLQDGCRLSAWKFFQIRQQDQKQAEEPLSPYSIVCLRPSSDPVQILMLCGDLG
ncbi:hypothetical protein TNCV_2869681 [Trichonephila clavipes]|nr:hypothetical protein TNCV_2869681 [Trichonephila clavipes]